MTNEEILKKVFEKARENGWKEEFWYKWNTNTWEDYAIHDEHLMSIFKHDFAKAFWGDKKICIDCERWHSSLSDCDCGVGNSNPEWEIRLRQMVIEEEPIKYLEGFL